MPMVIRERVLLFDSEKSSLEEGLRAKEVRMKIGTQRGETERHTKPSKGVALKGNHLNSLKQRNELIDCHIRLRMAFCARPRMKRHFGERPWRPWSKEIPRNKKKKSKERRTRLRERSMLTLKGVRKECGNLCFQWGKTKKSLRNKCKKLKDITTMNDERRGGEKERVGEGKGSERGGVKSAKIGTVTTTQSAKCSPL